MPSRLDERSDQATKEVSNWTHLTCPVVALAGTMREKWLLETKTIYGLGKGAAALFGEPFVNYDKLFEIYASDLAKGAEAKGPGDQFESMKNYPL
ncbi:unnamed protein product [Urochloa humidicola]